MPPPLCSMLAPTSHSSPGEASKQRCNVLCLFILFLPLIYFVLVISSSCFLLAMQDDSIEGIYDTLKQCALISKSAGGIGIAVSCIRGTGSYIAGVSLMQMQQSSQRQKIGGLSLGDFLLLFVLFVCLSRQTAAPMDWSPCFESTTTLLGMSTRVATR